MIYIAVVFFSAFLTYFIRKMALKKAILDIPNHRSSHEKPTPRGGGLAIVIAFYLGLCWFFIGGQISSNLFYALLMALPIAIIGLLDDILDISSAKRFAVQIACAALALYFLQISWQWFFMALLLIVWFTNLFNFLDGIDGYVSIETLFLAIAVFVLFGDKGIVLLGASVLGFLPFNWQRASIFMGDVGSTFIGFVLGVWFIYYGDNFHTIAIWLLLTMPFWFDATYTLVRRFINAEVITQAHKKHLFQRAVQSKMSHQSVSLFLLGINLTILGALFLMKEHILILLFVFFLLFIYVSYVIEKRVPFDV